MVDADLKSYFDTIPKDRLMALVAGKVADGRVLALVESFLGTECPGGRPGMGTRTGHAARRGDQSAAEQHLSGPAGSSDGGEGYEMVRYADDFVILCRTPEDAAEALAVVRGLDGVEPD